MLTRLRPRLLLAFLFFAVASCGDAPSGPGGNPPPPDDTTAPIARILDSIRLANDLPALGGAIVTVDSVWAVAAVGKRRYSGTVQVTSSDKFHLGSNLKAMTSGMIGRLVDAGILSWDVTLEAALPDFASTMLPEYRAVTLDDLLAHTAGLRRDPTLDVMTASTPEQQRVDVTRWALAQTAGPRGVYSYSNVGYMIAGLIAERAAGVPFESLIVQRLFTPLGISTAGFGAMGTAGMEDQPWQHYFEGTTLHEVPPGPNAEILPFAYGSAGRVHMNLRDWARFVRAMLLAERGDVSVWSAATAAKLTAPHVGTTSDGYAMGWRITQRSWAPGKILTHDGTNTRNFSVAWAAPQAGFAVFIVTNQGGSRAQQAIDGAASRLIGLYLTGR